jgi:hypothetical protein
LKVYAKVIKMPRWIAWVQKPSGLIKTEGSTSTFKAKNVSWKRISIIDLNCYHIDKIYIVVVFKKTQKGFTNFPTG